MKQHRRTCLIIVIIIIIVLRSCNDGSNPAIYNTAAPLGNGLDPENNHSAHIHAISIMIL